MIGNCPPILFVIFNRPDLTEHVFKSVREARPRQLFIAADGPRLNVPGDLDLCKRARQVLDLVDWDCEVKRLLRGENLGCKLAVGGAIHWFFEHVEAGIILEDDCVPDRSFFSYAAELLDRFASDERVMAISGNSFQPDVAGRGCSYYFSRYNHVWGWATWARAWQHCDLEMSLWPLVRNGAWLKDILGDSQAVMYWEDLFDSAYRKEIDTWDFAWTFACWAQGALTALPCVNLVENIGFDDRATHTRTRRPGFPPRAKSLRFPLQHPPVLVRDASADEWSERVLFSGTQVPADVGFSRVLRAVGRRTSALAHRLIRKPST